MSLELPVSRSEPIVRPMPQKRHCKAPNSSVDLEQLCEIGVLQELASGKEKLFVNSRLMSLMSQDTNTYKAFT